MTDPAICPYCHETLAVGCHDWCDCPVCLGLCEDCQKRDATNDGSPHGMLCEPCSIKRAERASNHLPSDFTGYTSNH